MMKTKKSLSAMMVAMICVLSLGIANVSLAASWEEFMTKKESKAIKTMVKKSVLKELEDPTSDWQGILDKDVVEDDIVKQAVYSEVAPSTATGAGITVCEAGDVDECTYYDDVEVDEIDVTETPDVTVIYKVTDTDWISDSGFTDTYQMGTGVKLRDGHVYVPYGNGDNGVFEGTFTDYRLIVNY